MKTENRPANSNSKIEAGASAASVMASRLSNLVAVMDDAYQAQRLNWEISFLAPTLHLPKVASGECRTVQGREADPKSESHPSMSLAAIDDLREVLKARAKHQRTSADKLWHRILEGFGFESP